MLPRFRLGLGLSGPQPLDFYCGIQSWRERRKENEGVRERENRE
jgi:hypothetical protein